MLLQQAFPGCLKLVAAWHHCCMMQKKKKLTFGTNTIARTTHSLRTLFRVKNIVHSKTKLTLFKEMCEKPLN